MRQRERGTRGRSALLPRCPTTQFPFNFKLHLERDGSAASGSAHRAAVEWHCEKERSPVGSMGWCDQIADPAVARTVTKIVCYPVGLLISELFRLGCGVLEDEWCPAAFSDQRFSTIGGLILASVVVEHFSKVISVKLWTSREHLDRISLSLNILTLPAAGAAGPSAQPKRQLRLRTLWEKQLDEIIPNKGGRAIFRKTARGSNSAQASYPFLEDTEINHDLVSSCIDCELVRSTAMVDYMHFCGSTALNPQQQYTYGVLPAQLSATSLTEHRCVCR